MLRRVLALAAALALAGLLSPAPALAAPSVTVGPITIMGNPGCC